MKVARSRGLTEETVSAIGKSALRSKLLGPTKWGDKLLNAGDKLLKSKKDAGGWLKLLQGSLKDGFEGSKHLMRSGKDLLHTLHQAGIKNVTANLARQGWQTLKTNLGDAGKAVHQSWKNGVKTVHDFASDWSSARKLAADTAQNYPHNTVMRDFWDGQFKKLDAWNKGSNWTISNTVMDVRNAYTDFRNIHDMKNTVQLGKHMEQWEHMTQWDHLGFWQRTGNYMNAGYDTLKVTKIVKPYVQPTDNGLTWKNDAKSYVKTLVPDPMKLWNYDTLVNAPGKLVKAVSD
ncbi:hypothetical protein JS530_03140 [Bifidobacterium sp. LC6]|uniref:Uncharacterized protein n=2 Tax=Bifidobacterium colobi TaxID=2809026 RepID=A0ABS5UTY8_9BIFI|nr:hypothetical protein [Bifidobacterium colobi]